MNLDFSNIKVLLIGDLMLDHYDSDNQITFFVPNEEEVYTLSELTEILI